MRAVVPIVEMRYPGMCAGCPFAEQGGNISTSIVYFLCYSSLFLLLQMFYDIYAHILVCVWI